MAQLSITPSTVVPGTAAVKRTLIAAEAIEAGETIYKDTDGKAALTDASDTDKIGVIGVACNTAEVAGQPVTYAVTDEAFDLGASVTNGEPVLLDDVPGKLCTDIADLASGSTPVQIALGKGTTIVEVNADNVMSGTVIA